MSDSIAILGSARRHGNTGKLVDWIAGELEIEVVYLGDKKISAFDYDHKNMEDDFLPLMDHVFGFENLILCSPVYWYTVSTQLKTFIDRFSDFLHVPELKDRGRLLKGKTGYVICTSLNKDAPASFIDPLRNTFSYLGMSFGGYVHADCSEGYRPQNYVAAVAEFTRKVRHRGART